MSVCSKILGISPYQGGKPISEIERQLGIKNIVKLASNENPNGVSQKVIEAIINATTEVNFYPDGNTFELKQALSKHLSVNDTQITLGNGSNDILELAARCFVCDPADEVIFSEYAFVVYPLVTKALGAKSVVTKSCNFGHNLELMLAAITAKTKLIFIANPNNPTGTFLTDEAIFEFLLKVPKSVIVVLDQAYFEYLQAPDLASALVGQFSNLIITRSFSKAYGLAGLRVGYSISSTQNADYLNRIRQPFNVNNLAEVAAVAALKDDDFLAKSVAANSAGLSQLTRGFEDLGLSFIPSYANFIAVKIDTAKNVYQKLLERGFITRLVEMEDYLRVSVGTKNQNTDFLNVLKSVL